METLQLRVSRADSKSRKFYVEYKDRQWPVKMVPEQYDENAPETLACVVTVDSDGTHIEQDIPTLIRRHYSEGDEQVMELTRVTSEVYELTDAWGYRAVAEKQVVLDPTLTKRVRCRVVAIAGRAARVEVLETLKGGEGSFFAYRGKIGDRLKEAEYPGLADLLLCEPTSDSFDVRCMEWVMSQSEVRKADAGWADRVGEACRRLIEEDAFLAEQVDAKDRGPLVARLSAVVESMGYLRQAEAVLAEGRGRQEVEEFCRRLTASGLLYHVRDQFRRVMYLFLLSPDLIETMSQPLADAIRSHTAAFWQGAGMDGEWVVMLEYCARMLNERTDILNERDKAALMVRTLGLQQNLTDDETEGLYDRVLNRARLLRYASELRVPKPAVMVERAFHNLMGAVESDMQYDTVHCTDPDVVANILYNKPDEPPATVKAQVYRGENALVRVDAAGISLMPCGTDPDEAYSVLPTNSRLWHGLQVLLPHKIRDRRSENIVRTVEVWKEIDHHLLSAKAAARPVSTVFYQNGDEVRFVVRRQNSEGFECEIVEGETPAKATLKVSDVVHYLVPNVALRAFRDEEGHPLVFRGKVTDYSRGAYSLSLFEDVCDATAEAHSKLYDEDPQYTLVCHVYYYNPTFHRYIGYSEEGFAVSVRVDDEAQPWSHFGQHAIIEIGETDRQLNNNFVQGTFLREHLAPMPPAADCFARLMDISAVDTMPDADFADSRVDQSVVSDLGRERVRELVALIERVAVMSDNYLHAYSYLGVCRLMCVIIGDTEKEEYYGKRLSLIELLCRFNDTDTVDTAALTAIENVNPTFFTSHSQLRRALYQLKLVGCMNKPGLFDFVAQMKREAADSELESLARLVMAYNLLLEEGITRESDIVHDEIFAHLRLQRRVTDKKYYGEESQEVEFKQSLVYPPDSGMQANLGRQTTEILSQICAFLNSGGGCLYLGVNDAGYEFGVERDLQYEYFAGGTREKYMLYLGNQVHDRIGAYAQRFVTMKWDTGVESDVLIVSVRDCDQLVSLDGTYFERRGTSVRAVKDVADFRRFRLAQLGLPTDEPLPGSDTPETAAPVEAAPAASAPEPVEADGLAGEEDSQRPAIATSQARNNALHDFEPDFAGDAIGYIALLDGGKYAFYHSETWEESLLTLVVHEAEADGHLVCVYEGGYAVRVPIAQLAGRANGQPYFRNRDRRMLFACPATDDDALMSILTNNKGERFVRFDQVGDLESGSMDDTGRPVGDAPFNEALQFDIVPLARLRDAQLTTGKRNIGLALKAVEGQRAIEMLKQMGIGVDD